jgi:hypothetical protein
MKMYGGLELSVILDLGTRWRWVVRLGPRPFYLWEKLPVSIGKEDGVGPRTGLDSVA